MKLPTARIRTGAVFTGLLLTAALCGASPQEERARRETPQPQMNDNHRRMEPPPRSMDHAPRPSRTTEPGESRPRGPGVRTVDFEIRRPAGEPRPGPVTTYPGTNVVVPPAWGRCTVQPTTRYWRQRDIMAEIQTLSRRGFIPVTGLGDGVDVLTDFVQTPAGWRAYGVAVPAGGTVQFEVQHPSLAWFRLMLMDRNGRPGKGMLQAAIAHQPVLVTYKNTDKVASAVYVLVDDPAWWSDAKNPYTLAIRRDWDPAKADVSQVKLVAGIWGASPSVSAQFAGPSLTGPAVYPH